MAHTKNWSSHTGEEIEKMFSVRKETGLSEDEARSRKKKYGSNTFSSEKGSRFFRIVGKQIKNPLVLILLFSGVTTFFLEAYIDTLVIAIALFINIAVDIFQRGRASRAFKKLKDSQRTYAFLLRDGKKIKLLQEELVPGDVIFIEPGLSVPADARLVSSNLLRVNESALTGEWIDVEKDADKNVGSTRITDQTNMVWMGTLVSSGNGTAIVVETGEETQLGKIAEGLKGVEEEDTPLQKTIRTLGHFIAAIVLVVIAFLTLFGILAGNGVYEMLLVAVAIAVAAIPEGLPAAVTVVLAIGMERILNKQGLVRNLLAAETLGSTTTILTDKTGTLTQAKMEVRTVATLLHIQEGNHEGEERLTLRNDDERGVLERAVRASDAFIEKDKDEDTGLPRAEGRPVEKAIVYAGILSGLNKDRLLEEKPQTRFIPFSSKRAFSASFHKDKEGEEVVVVGAPEKILDRSNKVLSSGKGVQLTEELREELVAFQEKLSREGARFIAVGFKEITTSKGDVEEKLTGDFTFGGFIVLDDPIRPRAVDAIRIAKESGVRVIMMTGDHPGTASRIATLVGIADENDRFLTGHDVEKLSDKELLTELSRTKIFARMLPEQKLRVARLLKGEGEVVAMTGDGINDAPALRNADIGVALGSGTDVAKEASDLILLNDGFDIIVYAIEEGRRIIDNLKKITAYLLSTGFSEIALVGGVLLLNAPLPLLPAQILWVNIVSEGFMNFAFAFEKGEEGIMKRNPRVVKSTILTRELKKLILVIGSVSGVFLIGVYFFLSLFDLTLSEIRTGMFVALSASSIFFSLSLKNIHKPIWRINLFSNKYLLYALGMSLLFLFGALLLPPIQTLLSLEAFSLPLFSLMVLFGIINLFFIELVKYLFFIRKNVEI